MRQARELYGNKEGHHATPSEIAVTLAVEPSLQSKQRDLPDPAPPDRSTARRISAAGIRPDAWGPTPSWPLQTMGSPCWKQPLRH